tara:strand:+ start:4772 stop:5236 length:465 start_codon:yes stop_codon:yes gene_type:complete
MNSRIYKIFSQFLVLLVATFTLAACENNGRGYPPVAEAPTLDYVDGKELRSRMQQLAFELQMLDSSLAAEYDEGPLPQQSVVDSLRNIERIAQALQPRDLSSSHPFLLKDLDRLLSDVSRAKIDAAKNRYYMAGRISGACASCHRTAYSGLFNQ